MANEVTPLFRGGHPDLTAEATATISGGRFVAISATIQSGPGLTTEASGGNVKVAHAGAGLSAFGVSSQDAASGAKLAILMPGSIVPMTADGAITANALVEVGTAGKPKTIASGVAVGRAVSTAADTATVYVRIGG